MIKYIQFDVSLFHFLHSNIPDNNPHKQKWHMLFFIHIKVVERQTSMHQMDKTGGTLFFASTLI